MSHRLCIFAVGMMLLSVAGCHKTGAMEQEALDTPVAPETVGEKTCGTETMRADDAEKWDCVPGKGYWCTDPDGCPYYGSIFHAGMRLKYAFPLPQGKGYIYTGKIGYVVEDRYSDGFANIIGACMSDEGCECDKKKIAKESFCDRPQDWRCTWDGGCECGKNKIAKNAYCDENDNYQSGWVCVLDEGCACGSGKIAKGAFCFGDMYEAKDAVDGACNKDNCPAFCQIDKCVYGDIEIPPNRRGYESIRQSRQRKLEICVRDAGCKDGDIERALGEARYLNKGYLAIDFVNCMQDEGCPCGNEHCQKGQGCYERGSWGWECSGGNSQKQDVDFKCKDAKGCSCGNQLCPEGYQCHDGLCVYSVDYSSEGNRHVVEIFYCDKPEGCACGADGYGGYRCPKGAMCSTEDFHDGWSTFWNAHLCESVSDKYKDSKALFNFLKSSKPDAESEPDKPIERYLYSKKTDAEIMKSKSILSLDTYSDGDQHEMVIRNGKRFGNTQYDGWTVLCSEPGCDCIGEPLKEGYICVEQTPDIYEQVCFDDKGCKCGDGIIMAGDICVDGRAQCATLHSRLGCMCGGTELKDKDYRCYAGRLRCQSKQCKCGDQKISNGDFCDHGQAVCGDESLSTGCMCGGMPLREGYMCDEQMQRCHCKFVEPQKVESGDGDEEEGEDDDEVDEETMRERLRSTCTCPCGTEQIGYGFGCLDGNTPEKLPEIVSPGVKKIGDGEYEIVDEELADFSILTCGDKELIIERNGDMYKRKLSKTGKYRWEEKIDDDHPEDRGLFCTCGTGKPIPGDHYGCGLVKYGEHGAGSEWSVRFTFKGYQCRSYDGCACGEDTCMPGDICDISDNGSMKCKAFLTFDGTCGNHQLSPSIIYHGGYRCYSEYHSDFAQGWYCRNQEGCACGDIRCEYGHMCLAPGYCGMNKNVTSDGFSFKFPKIMLYDSNDIEE